MARFDCVSTVLARSRRKKQVAVYRYRIRADLYCRVDVCESMRRVLLLPHRTIPQSLDGFRCSHFSELLDVSSYL